MKTIVVAAPFSGSGKTTVTLGLLAALGRMGLRVQPFKSGPDYIDPGLHASVVGRPSYNLDTWMMGSDGVVRTFRRASKGADVAIVEGVMGLFDGRGGAGEEGSTAHLARVLGAPVLLVVDASGAAGSIAALVKGFSEFDPRVDLRWVLFNRVGSLSHYNMLVDAVKRHTSVRPVGWLPRDPALELPSRHLGLVTSGDLARGPWRRFIRKAADTVEARVNMSSLGIGKKRRKAPGAEGRAPSNRTKVSERQRVRIGVALDRAFTFYYHENLEILEGSGAELVFFSPLRDGRLPRGLSGIYLGGGYPELHGKALSSNACMLEDIRKASLDGMPVYAECGGLIYLCRTLVDRDGARWPMAGVFPFVVRMTPRRSALGYREVTVKGGPLVEPGQVVRGHEFHYSAIKGATRGVERVFSFSGKMVKGAKGTGDDGFLINNTLAGYTHLHFASNPAFARGIVDACRRFRGR